MKIQSKYLEQIHKFHMLIIGAYERNYARLVQNICFLSELKIAIIIKLLLQLANTHMYIYACVYKC